MFFATLQNRDENSLYSLKMLRPYDIEVLTGFGANKRVTFLFVNNLPFAELNNPKTKINRIAMTVFHDVTLDSDWTA